ncbi:spore germination protein [Neobacillus ginsengisoli]|uniref:Spore germination protein n=1 Tax=Neobacillus ginsengisoli TaxID=904295 RepID=A0ABT9XXS5_9BACI|nr:spore germination protein [Neobacillus ginsengisoli]MDQ0200055.1 hypothetical protein [Neobacillus ginsengisoli]
MAINKDGINIGTVSGGIVNFGGAVTIAPISVSKSVNGAGGNNTGGQIITISGSSSSNQINIKE